MADVLDQTEVDALLSAVDGGAVETSDPELAAPGQPRQQEIHSYDFKRPERVSKDQIRSLEAIHESFARNFGASLSAFLRTIVEIRVATIEQLTYSEFIHSLPNPTCFNLLNASPLEGQLCMEISPLIVYPIIDRLLGGSSAELFIPQRPLTIIEWRLVERITNRALATLTEGWSSLLLHLCPPEQLPYYLWWYDRCVGRLTPETMAHRFDSDRHGTVWALLYYPPDVTAKDPTGVFPAAVADSRGYIFFRNRWKDANDIMASIIAQVRKDQKGWNQPEQLAINLMGFDTRFIGGPVKDTKPEAYSSLLVDGKYTYRDATNPMGKLLAFEPGEKGGYAVVQGGQMYTKLGVKQAVRHMLVDFSLPGNQAVVATLDRIQADGEHTYTWQANVGTAAKFGTEGDRKFFLMKGRNDGHAKGWVLHPAEAEVGPGADPVRISTKAADADIWVVMLVGQGTPPTAAFAGTGMNTTVTVGGRTVKWDSTKGRMLCEE